MKSLIAGLMGLAVLAAAVGCNVPPRPEAGSYKAVDVGEKARAIMWARAAAEGEELLMLERLRRDSIDQSQVAWHDSRLYSDLSAMAWIDPGLTELDERAVAAQYIVLAETRQNTAEAYLHQAGSFDSAMRYVSGYQHNNMRRAYQYNDAYMAMPR